MNINKDMTYRELFEIPEFEDMKDYLSYMASAELLKLMPDAKISDNIPEAWNSQDIADGYRRIYELKSAGVQVLHQIYEQGELEKEPEKKQTGLLWFPAEKEGAFAVICAGGAYMSVASNVEAFPVAAQLNQLGIHAFVLKYRTGVECSAKKAEEDLHQAVRYIFSHRENFHVTDDYAVFGFSSGGHLAAEYGTYNRGYAVAGLPKPSMLGLAYPAVALDYRSELMDMIVRTMLKPEWEEEDREEFNVFAHMDKTYPKTFLWQTVEDESIPYMLNFIPLKEQLEKNHIPHIAKSVQHGKHGLGLGNGSEAEGWLSEAVEFWQKDKND